MSSHHRSGRAAKIRLEIAREAARLKMEEGVPSYHDAKRIAARRIFGRAGQRRLNFRPALLPSNGEIRAHVLLLADLDEGEDRLRRLFDMRVLALWCLHQLEDFDARLMGSVATGHARRGSDIDLHVFADDPDHFEALLEDLDWDVEFDEVTIQKHGQIQQYLHYRVDFEHPVEISLYPRMELRKRSRSSTDGKPIDRLSPKRVVQLLEAEHAEEWAAYLAE